MNLKYRKCHTSRCLLWQGFELSVASRWIFLVFFQKRTSKETPLKHTENKIDCFTFFLVCSADTTTFWIVAISKPLTNNSILDGAIWEMRRRNGYLERLVGVKPSMVAQWAEMPSNFPFCHQEHVPPTLTLVFAILWPVLLPWGLYQYASFWANCNPSERKKVWRINSPWSLSYVTAWSISYTLSFALFFFFFTVLYLKTCSESGFLDISLIHSTTVQ